MRLFLLSIVLLIGLGAKGQDIPIQQSEPLLIEESLPDIAPQPPSIQITPEGNLEIIEEFDEEDKEEHLIFEFGEENPKMIDQKVLEKTVEEYKLPPELIKGDFLEGITKEPTKAIIDPLEFQFLFENIDPSELQITIDGISIDPDAELPSLLDGAELDPSFKAIVDDTELDTRKRQAYGPSQYDSRIDIRKLRNDQAWQRKILYAARGVGMVIEKDKLHAISDTVFQLDIRSTLKELYNLCPDEAFKDQPVIGTGTAFLNGRNTMVTASHVFEGPISDYLVIFGFEMVNEKGGYSSIVTQNNIYQPTRIISRQEDLDVAVFEIDRNADRPQLPIGNSSAYQKGAPVYMLGYPSGLPQKVALNASIQGESNYQYFHTTLDAFQGNSGSPVLSLETNEVIGILVAGEVDYHWNGNCNQSKDCRIPYCKGEKVSRIEQLTPPQ